MDMKSGLDELNKRIEISLRMGGEDRIEKHHQSGHLTARERISTLVDPGSFIELHQLRRHGIPGKGGKVVPSERIHGFGKIGGKNVCLYADDRTILGGSSEGDFVRAKSIASLRPDVTHFPVVFLGDGGGARVQAHQGSDNVLGGIFLYHFDNPRTAPFISTIMGDCFGYASWIAAIADLVVMVKGSCLAVAGPNVLEIAKTERITPEELGGWQVHAEQTGIVDLFAENDEHCLQLVRQLCGFLPANCHEEPPHVPTGDTPDRRTEQLLDILPEKTNRGYDMLKVIEGVVDDGNYLSLKPHFGKALITCLARMNGRTVGIIANQPNHQAGAPGPSECEKATSFIVLCDSYNIPLIFFHDTPGFLVGAEAEKCKLPLKVMIWQQALNRSTVPRICLILRKSYGMASLNMGNVFDPDFIAAWPTADISFMSAEAGTNVVYSRRIKEAEDPEAERAKLIKQMEFDSAPWRAAEKGLLDDVIDPGDTRKYINERLDILHASRGFVSKKGLQSWPTGF